MNNIKQIASQDISAFLTTNKNTILLDVRTTQEWETVGMPDGEKLGISTYFLSVMEGEERKLNENFVRDFQAKGIDTEKYILIICRSGVRSNLSAQLLQKAGFKNCMNVSDGFEGNKEIGVGWKQSQLPCKYKMDHQKYRQNTNLVRGGLQRSQFLETSEAIFLSSGFVYQDAQTAEAIFAGEQTGFQYSRYANPTVEMFEQRMALLEEAESCFATASGMSAVFAAILCQLQQGDHLLSSIALFGSCRYIISEILPKYGIETTKIDGKDLQAWKQNIRKNTKVIFLETPSNPCLEQIDIEGVCEIAKNNGTKVIVDNILASPILQKPMKMGADIVVYSGTKHIDGQGRCLGGAVLSDEKFKEELLKPFLKHTGPCLSPFNAWVLLKGLETLKIRVEQQSKSAQKIALYLENHPKIQKVYYPFLASNIQLALAKKQQLSGGTVLSFKIKGGKEQAFSLMNNLTLMDISNNLGDTKSLVTHPHTTTHKILPEEEKKILGISENLVRISAGLEDVEDLIEDLEQALK